MTIGTGPISSAPISGDEITHYRLAAGAGSFTLSGQAATLYRAFTLTGAAGSFTLSGLAASLVSTRIVSAAAGSFSLAGQAATLYRAITLTAGAGSFTLSGQAASLVSGRVLSAAAGGFTLTGQNATLSTTGAYRLTCNAGAFTLAGQDAGLAATRLLAGAAGTYTLTGQAAALTYTPNAVAYTLTAEAGAFTLNGQDAALAYVANDQTITGGGGGEFKPSKRLRQIERQRQKARKRLDDYLTRAFDLVDGTPPEVEAPEPVAEQVIERLAVMPDPEALRLVAGIRAELIVLRDMAEQAQRLRDDDDAIIALLLAA